VLWKQNVEGLSTERELSLVKRFCQKIDTTFCLAHIYGACAHDR
jgi:hypothetical protein